MKICYHCTHPVHLPQAQISLIGTDRKQWKKDLFDFCPNCFEYLFGNVIFSTDKMAAMACHLCDSKLITAIPYSYFIHLAQLNNGKLITGKRRVCSICSEHELFPVISSLLIVNPTKHLK